MTQTTDEGVRVPRRFLAHLLEFVNAPALQLHQRLAEASDDVLHDVESCFVCRIRSTRNGH